LDIILEPWTWKSPLCCVFEGFVETAKIQQVPKGDEYKTRGVVLNSSPRSTGGGKRRGKKNT